MGETTKSARTKVAGRSRDVTGPPVAGWLLCRRNWPPKSFFFDRAGRRIFPMAKFTLNINGRTHEIDGEAGDSLLSVLRYDLGLTGSKFGCGEGYCGACTVMVDNQVARSCTMRLGAVAGKPITTIEAVADGERLHPVQE